MSASLGHIRISSWPVATDVTTSTIPASATAVALLAANSRRLGVSIFNDSTASLCVMVGGTPTTSSFTVRILAGGFLELAIPFGVEVKGIWTAANGNAHVTDYKVAA